jgi:hypothetical protein
MPEIVSGRPIYWVEPAHPGIVKQHADIVALYRAIRERVQPQIDQAFDNVSRAIGFVVATTVPVAVTVDDKGGVTEAAVRSGQFKGTLFERELAQAFAPLVGHAVAGLGAGTYNIYAIWQSALALALRRDWVEPAHVGVATPQLGAAVEQRMLPPGVREPAHFLDGRIQLTSEETVLVSAIDEVYPELRLAERVAASRVATRPVAVSPHVMEPAHFRTSDLLRNDDFVAALNQLVQKYGR